jgi:hypothetical protein
MGSELSLGDSPNVDTPTKTSAIHFNVIVVSLRNWTPGSSSALSIFGRFATSAFVHPSLMADLIAFPLLPL